MGERFQNISGQSRERVETQLTTVSENVPVPSEQTSLHRATLQEFAEHPITAQEITSKADYEKKFRTWFASALLTAGYNGSDINTLIVKSLDKVDFNKPAEEFVADINRIVHNMYYAAPTTLAPEVVAPVIESEPVVAPKPETLVLENPLPSPLVLTNNERVHDVVDYRAKFNNLSEQPFNHSEYLEFVFDVHAGLRNQYDGVVNNARTNLKRFSTDYTPSKTEKEALQLLSSLQGQYARMQKTDSGTGVVRAELMNSLEQVTSPTSEIDIKTHTENYITEVEKIQATINKLESLIEIAKAEDKPPFTETYRTLLDKMQFEGNQVLATIPTSHPLYSQFKFLVVDDLASLTRFASVEENGDKNLREQSSVFMVRRNRIKAAIAYMKTEHEYEGYEVRANKRVQELTLSLENITATNPEAVALKNTILATIDDIKVRLATDNRISADSAMAFAVADSVFEKVDVLKSQKQSIQNELGGVRELFLKLSGQSEEVSAVETVEKALPAVLTESNTLPSNIFNFYRARKEKLLANDQLSPAVTERAQRVVTRIFRGDKQEQKVKKVFRTEYKDVLRHNVKILYYKLGLVLCAVGGVMNAGLLAGVVTGVIDFPHDTKKTQLKSQYENLQNMTSSVTSEINFDSIMDYLRTIPKTVVPNPAIAEVLARTEDDRQAQTNNTAKNIQPSSIAPQGVMDTAPVLATSQTPVEVVPGVAFAATTEQVVMPDAPDLKIFSAQADQVPSDDGIVFDTPAEEVPDTMYQINFGDRFWDINEGETLAGKLPVMSQINPYFKQSLIDRLRDAINSSAELRTKIGAMGETADELRTDEYMNVTELNDLAERIAVEYGYLS